MNNFKEIKELTAYTLKLRSDLSAALTFKHDRLIKDLTYKLTCTNAKIVDLIIDQLERVEKRYADSIICPAINSDIQIENYTPVHFDGIDGNGLE